ncbi:hypothetical protein CONPUDRAFT_70689 [Coniophora puteana RWD-64-598 SS2]|uniref:Uncharacterized protein n=1 Tax=Coniophora puteana (strain RWD-64-598) TaxID=741705 RepID=A0A5M3MXB8_CONPW|nr:uncharacterized protein CONPUDRAFT_70689 [Coniophora puteana RWD-64-598 SS2]EIW83730.1 hypothetical protein CONPUDRAFT_70689 [Coniophora puteana RWD-64-598 SS2]
MTLSCLLTVSATYYEALDARDKYIIMSVQNYEGKVHRYVGYPVVDALQMMGRAHCPREDDRSRCVLMIQQTRTEFYKEFEATYGGGGRSSITTFTKVQTQVPQVLYMLDEAVFIGVPTVSDEAICAKLALLRL